MHSIPARRGGSILLKNGQRLRVYNLYGTQVVDLFAFSPAALEACSESSSPERLEYLCMAHSRVSTFHLIPQPGDVLVSNLSRPMLTILTDTWIEGGGTHDTLIPACDEKRYRNLGVKFPDDPDPGKGHRSCATNLEEELCKYLGDKCKGLGSRIETPAPLNLFMNVPWARYSARKPDNNLDHDEDVRYGKLQIAAPAGKSGGYVELKAEMDLLVIMSACPNDMANTNGEEMLCKDAGFDVLV